MEYLVGRDPENLTDAGLVVSMESGRKHVRGSFTFRIEQNENGSFIASIIQKDDEPEDDDVGALYYVVVVIFLYGCSILMMIASYIRKNNVDRKLNRYLKEMATVRKRERQIQLFNAAAKAAAQTRKSLCLEGTEISLVAEKWSRFHETAVDSDTQRRQRRQGQHGEEQERQQIQSGRRARCRERSVDSTTDDSSRKPSDRSEFDLDTEPRPTRSGRADVGGGGGGDALLSPRMKGSERRPSVRIVCEPSDPDSDNEAFLTDDPDERRQPRPPGGATGRRKRSVLFETTDGETSLDDDNDDGSRDALLGPNSRDQDDPEIQITEDSESDLFLGRQDSKRIQWQDFQVVSSV